MWDRTVLAVIWHGRVGVAGMARLNITGKHSDTLIVDRTVLAVIWHGRVGVAGMARLNITGKHSDTLTDRDLLSPSENQPTNHLVSIFDVAVQWQLTALTCLEPALCQRDLLWPNTVVSNPNLNAPAGA